MAWIDEYKMDMANYVAKHDQKLKSSDYLPLFEDTKEAKHMQGCVVKVIHSGPDEHFESFHYFDSFGGSEKDEAFVTVNYSCSCGKVKKYGASAHETIRRNHKSPF